MTIGVLAVLGLVMGSFITALVDRLHDGRDWVKGRSSCDSCKKTLAARDLVPVLSWLSSAGKCRQCKQKISWQYPIIELVTGALFVISYLAWPTDIVGFQQAKFTIWLITLVGLIALSVYDLRWFIIPNRIIYPLIALMTAVIAVESVFYGGGPALVRDSVLGLLACGGLFYVLFQVSGGRWIGGGDVKLGFLLGMLAGGVFESLMLVMLASVIGLVFSLPLILTKKLGPKSQIPFGPVLVVAGIVIFLAGESIVDWYLNGVIS